ncbi:MAG: 16S rRNA (uracil(1498)-N(3))-methyltransferase [Bacteroidota bacterium]
MQLFYTPHIDGTAIRLEEEEARHCAQVLRKQVGDTIQVVDGRGGFYEVELLEVQKKACLGQITHQQMDFGKRPYYLHLAIAPTKNIARLEWFLEKATEIGIDEISLFTSHHSERRRVRLDRLERIVVSAMKQSVKAYLPKLNELVDFPTFIQQLQFDGKRYIAHCQAGEKASLKNNYPPEANVCILIGPEGDFSLDEIQLAEANGFEGLSLGTSRLRTETAGVVACHSINFLNNL